MEYNFTKGFETLKTCVENDFSKRFPSTSKVVDNITIKRGTEEHFSSARKNQAVIATVTDSMCKQDMEAGKYKPLINKVFSEEANNFVDSQLNSLTKKGMTTDSALTLIKSKIKTVGAFNPRTQQFDVMPQIDGITDSVIESMAMAPWNVGMLTKIFKQPFVQSYAKRLVSVTGFSNAWADYVSVFKESFEGTGNLATRASGSIESNANSPVSNEVSMLTTPIFNLSVDYESSIAEGIMAGKEGNWMTSTIMADRERYATMILNRLQEVLIYFGSEEAGMQGLFNTASIEAYSGTPFSDASLTGADIVLAMNALVGDFCDENNFMPNQVKINVSKKVYRALTQKVYSETYNPDSPQKILQMNFQNGKPLDGGGAQMPSYSIACDPLLDANTAYNENSYDYMVMTVPSINDALSGDQSDLIISPEPLENYMIPCLWSRSGQLYTRVRRMGGIIAPIEGTVKVISGVGQQA